MTNLKKLLMELGNELVISCGADPHTDSRCVAIQRLTDELNEWGGFMEDSDESLRRGLEMAGVTERLGFKWPIVAKPKQMKHQCPSCNAENATGPTGRWRCSSCGLSKSERDMEAELESQAGARDKDHRPQPERNNDGTVCERCGGYGGGSWNGSDSPFQNYLPCYACGL